MKQISDKKVSRSMFPEECSTFLSKQQGIAEGALFPTEC